MTRVFILYVAAATPRNAGHRSRVKQHDNERPLPFPADDITTFREDCVQPRYTVTRGTQTHPQKKKENNLPQKQTRNTKETRLDRVLCASSDERSRRTILTSAAQVMRARSPRSESSDERSRLQSTPERRDGELLETFYCALPLCRFAALLGRFLCFDESAWPGYPQAALCRTSLATFG